MIIVQQKVQDLHFLDNKFGKLLKRAKFLKVQLIETIWVKSFDKQMIRAKQV